MEDVRRRKSRPSQAKRWRRRDYDNSPRDYRHLPEQPWYQNGSRHYNARQMRISQRPTYNKVPVCPYGRSSLSYQPPRRRENYDADEVRALEEKRRTTSLVMNKLQNLTAEDKCKSMKQLLVEPTDSTNQTSEPALSSREKEKEAKRIAHVKKPPRPTPPAPKKTKRVALLPHSGQHDPSHQERIKRKVFQDLLKMPINDLKNLATHPDKGDRAVLSQLLRKTKKELSEAMRNLAECKLQNRTNAGSPHLLTELENLVDADIAVDVSKMPVETIQAFQRFFDLDLESEICPQQPEEDDDDSYGMENSTDDDEMPYPEEYQNANLADSSVSQVMPTTGSNCGLIVRAVDRCGEESTLPRGTVAACAKVSDMIVSSSNDRIKSEVLAPHMEREGPRDANKQPKSQNSLTEVQSPCRMPTPSAPAIPGSRYKTPVSSSNQQKLIHIPQTTSLPTVVTEAAMKPSQSIPSLLSIVVFPPKDAVRRASQNSDSTTIQPLKNVSRDEPVTREVDEAKQSSQPPSRCKPVQSPTIGSVMTSVNVGKFHNLPLQSVKPPKAIKNVMKPLSHGSDSNPTQLSFQPTALTTNTTRLTSATTSVTSTVTSVKSAKSTPFVSSVTDSHSNLYCFDNIPVQAFGMAKTTERDAGGVSERQESGLTIVTKPTIPPNSTAKVTDTDHSPIGGFSKFDLAGVTKTTVANDIKNSKKTNGILSQSRQLLGAPKPSNVPDAADKSSSLDREIFSQFQLLESTKVPDNVADKNENIPQHAGAFLTTQMLRAIKPLTYVPKIKGESSSQDAHCSLSTILPSPRAEAEAEATEGNSHATLNCLNAAGGSEHIVSGQLDKATPDEDVCGKAGKHSITACISNDSKRSKIRTAGRRTVMNGTPPKESKNRCAIVGTLGNTVGTQIDGSMKSTKRGTISNIVCGKTNSAGSSPANSIKMPENSSDETSIVLEFQNFISDVRRLPQHSDLRRKVASHMIRVMTTSFESCFSLFMNAEVTNPVVNRRSSEEERQPSLQSSPAKRHRTAQEAANVATDSLARSTQEERAIKTNASSDIGYLNGLVRCRSDETENSNSSSTDNSRLVIDCQTTQEDVDDVSSTEIGLDDVLINDLKLRHCSVRLERHSSPIIN